MTNKTISTTEVRKNISKIMDEVEAGKTSYTIIRNNAVVARLVSKEFGDKNQISPNLAKEFAQVLADYGPALKELAKR
ncbi:MAG: type II toxin-antitoxin system Phd/YefM family antitoxin [Patescibacteria group bacterium]